VRWKSMMPDAAVSFAAVSAIAIAPER
jgi:hypothetical protein